MPVPVEGHWSPLEAEIEYLEVIENSHVDAYTSSIPGVIRGILYNNQSPDDLARRIRMEVASASSEVSNRGKQQLHLEWARNYMKSLQDKAILSASLRVRLEEWASPENTKAIIIKLAKQIAEEQKRCHPDCKKSLDQKAAWLGRIIVHMYAAPELAKYEQLQQLPTQLILEYI